LSALQGDILGPVLKGSGDSAFLYFMFITACSEMWLNYRDILHIRRKHITQ
jgi:hypothetical protein